VTGVGKLAVRTGTDENAHFRTATAIGGTGVGLDMLNDANSAVVGFTLRASATRLTGGVVSITDTTAGSASAGALVVTGGLSAGGASYFGGAVTTATGLYVGTGASGAFEAKSSSAGVPVTIAGFNTSTSASSDVAVCFQTQGSRNANWLLSRATGLLEMTDGYQTRGNVRVSFDPLNGNAVFGGAATFAGAVTVSSTTPTATLTRTSGTDSPRLSYSTGTDTAIIGMSGTASGLVASSIEGDIVLRTAASRSIRFTVDGGTSSAAVLSSTGATFAGAVTIGNTVNTVSPTSPNRTITMVVNGVTLYLAAKTTND
jgi:hypothetical protein